MSPELKKHLETMAQMMEELKAQAGGVALPAAAPAGAGGWLKPPVAVPAATTPAGWSVVMEIEVQGPKGAGKATIDLCYDGSTWNQAPEIVQGLIQQGYPVKVWVPKSSFGGGGFGARKWGG